MSLINIFLFPTICKSVQRQPRNLQLVVLCSCSSTWQTGWLIQHIHLSTPTSSGQWCIQHKLAKQESAAFREPDLSLLQGKWELLDVLFWGHSAWASDLYGLDNCIWRCSGHHEMYFAQVIVVKSDIYWHQFWSTLKIILANKYPETDMKTAVLKQ